LYALGQPRTDDEIIAQVLILTWAMATGRTLRGDVPPAELGVAELIAFWADDQTAGLASQPAARSSRLASGGR